MAESGIPRLGPGVFQWRNETAQGQVVFYEVASRGVCRDGYIIIVDLHLN